MSVIGCHEGKWFLTLGLQRLHTQQHLDPGNLTQGLPPWTVRRMTAFFITCMCVCYRFMEICFSRNYYVWQSRSDSVCCMKSTKDILDISACDRKFYGNSMDLLFLRSLLVEWAVCGKRSPKTSEKRQVWWDSWEEQQKSNQNVPGIWAGHSHWQLCMEYFVISYLFIFLMACWAFFFHLFTCWFRTGYHVY